MRGLPLDLAHLGDHAGSGSLWLAVTDTDAPLLPEAWYLHVWRPTYHSSPSSSLPAGLGTEVANIGEVMSIGDKNLGRISQRDGRFVADLEFRYGNTTSFFRGVMTPEVPRDPTNFAFSGSIRRVRMVLTRKPEVMSFLEEQMKLDQQKRNP